jgi:hypothetical protein
VQEGGFFLEFMMRFLSASILLSLSSAAAAMSTAPPYCVPECTAVDEVIPWVQHRHLQHVTAPVRTRNEAQTLLRDFIERHFPDIPYAAVTVPDEVWAALQKGMPPVFLDAHLHRWLPEGAATPAHKNTSAPSVNDPVLVPTTTSPVSSGTLKAPAH